MKGRESRYFLINNKLGHESQAIFSLMTLNVKCLIYSLQSLCTTNVLSNFNNKQRCT